MCVSEEGEGVCVCGGGERRGGGEEESRVKMEERRGGGGESRAPLDPCCVEVSAPEACQHLSGFTSSRCPLYFFPSATWTKL